ncbi:MAG: helix-turn-helix domain-containing protein [Candidatus Gastranaerophilales bacterium]|nr:helix-turn-helix domain-containing protein [Candidatus Gastranaerophilales bacterium]
MRKLNINKSSFELNKLITTSFLYSKIELSLSARLVLRCIVDYWNAALGYAYPTQKTIAKCTGLSEVSVGHAIKELVLKQLIAIEKQRKRNYYHFTISFFVYLELVPKVTYGHTLKRFGNIPQVALDNNILINKENASFLNFQYSFNEEEHFDEETKKQNEIERLKIILDTLENKPSLSKLAKKLQIQLKDLQKNEN